MPKYETTADYRGIKKTQKITADNPDDACYQYYRGIPPEEREDTRITNVRILSQISLYNPDEDCEGAD